VKVLAFNSSPNMEKGGTASILTPFLQGMEQAGAEVELFFVHKLNVRPCLGDKDCWLKTPGQCVQQDDMDRVYLKLAACDILVLGTPIYLDGMTGTLKTVLDRFIPLLQPFVEIRGDHCRHPLREEVKPGKKVCLVSVCGFTELDNFDPLVSHIQAVCKNFSWQFVGAVLRPYAVALPQLREMGVAIEDVYAAARDAGWQLVRYGKMRSETLATVSRELISRDQYVNQRNTSFQSVLARLRSG